MYHVRQHIEQWPVRSRCCSKIWCIRKRGSNEHAVDGWCDPQYEQTPFTDVAKGGRVEIPYQHYVKWKAVYWYWKGSVCSLCSSRKVKETSKKCPFEVIWTLAQRDIFQHDALCEIRTVAIQTRTFRLPNRQFLRYSIFQDDPTQNCHLGMQFQINLLAATHGADDSRR